MTSKFLKAVGLQIFGKTICTCVRVYILLKNRANGRGFILIDLQHTVNQTIAIRRKTAVPATFPCLLDATFHGLDTDVLTFDFSDSYCDWCTEENGGTPLCVSACPTRALELPAGATKENTIIGRAVINTDWCLAYKLIGCRFCYDACPYEAITLDDENRPVVLDNKCNGCGACESVCVSLQNGSISEGATSRAITIKPLDQVER